ncbi:hypothetical protein JKF63_04993 [Porcisia hertigi]|uniref:CHAT domain-containing protein n=1 Tax=Porcisia hertigi TaxID=2761500 RepID=A0A836LI66_9TRYP|nr:hypothetical protein JKF63_04993 [Porcisia hertigi]
MASPTALPPLSQGNDGGNSLYTAIPAPVFADGTIDHVALYRRFCAEEGCKANSALIRYITDRGGHFSLERLNLGSNYLGPKGLRPVMRMISLCETIVSINLERNGIDNDAVMDLCEVVQRHVSIASLNLSHNPISVSGGKRLLQLVEGNPRITHLLLSGTDIFEGLQSRIRMALQHNIAAQRTSGPKMIVNKEVSSFAATTDATGGRSPPSLPAIPQSKAALQVIHRPHSADKAAADGPSPGATAACSGAASRRSAANGSSSSHSGFSYNTPTTASDALTRHTWQEAALGRPQPRQPLPAVASLEHKGLPLNKVKDYKALFAERARLLMEINRGDASRRAYEARQELLALETHRRSHGATASGVQPHTYPGAETARATVLAPLPNEDNGGGCTAPNLTASDEEERTAAVEVNDNVQSPPPHSPLSATNVCRTDSPASATVVSARSAEAGLVDGTTGDVPAEQHEAHAIEEVLDPGRMMLLTMEEQFTLLFDQGCREYMNRNLDAAYMAWNEAMRIAVSEGQREWMAVVASNLQRLSYELLIEEGASHLERGELEQACDTFKLAHDVATKAKNAAWERDVHTAQENVQKALFHRCHEAALLLFLRAQDDMKGGIAATAVTEDDYFLLPGTEEMVRHTAAFVREWSCLLLLKEAIGLWVEATRVMARLSEVVAAPLRECVEETLSHVAAFIVEHHFNTTSPTGLTWFGTDAYLYHECILLSEVWYDLVAYSEQNLHHGLLSAICAAQLGELYVATFQLQQALVQLKKVVTYGRKHRCAVLEATGLTLCARLHLQRSDYGLAEAALEEALQLWTVLQSGPDSRALVNDRSASVPHKCDVALMGISGLATGESTAASAQTGEAPKGAANEFEEMIDTTGRYRGTTRFSLEEHLPADAVAVLARVCQHYKVYLLLHTYRYSAALEALESSLNNDYNDTLSEKLGRNFNTSPSLNEIAAVAGVLKTPLVYYTLTTKYDWSVEENVYKGEESLCIWVVAESQEMRFVEVNLTKDFKCTLRSLVSSLRQSLGVDPEMMMQSNIITELPSRTWQEPLRVLYQACIHPISGYVRTLDSKRLFNDGIITVVPSGQLWLVPFHALLNAKADDRYLVEDVAVQLAFSATQAAFAALSAERVQVQDMHREVVAVQGDADHDAADKLFYTPFPPNTNRSVEEAAAVAAMLSEGQVQLAKRLSQHTDHQTAILTHKVELVEDLESLRTVLPRARTVHIATPTTASAPLSRSIPVSQTAAQPEGEGGLVMRTASPMGDVGLMRAAEIAHMELAAEHVVLTNTNMSPQHIEGIRDDVLRLLRAFSGSGVPCVIAGQWCTPDMKPMELFQHFYAHWCHLPLTSLADISGSKATATEGGGTNGSVRGPMAPQPQRRVEVVKPGGNGAVTRHRASLLARSIRHLIAEEPAMRYRPRVWAGYYCIGTGW